MSVESIFLHLGGELVALERSAYNAEAVLQTLLEDFPQLLVGTSTGAGSVRLELIRREMPVADGAGASTMSLDHLFVDDQAVPVLVEVKRASDPRIRREVVGQLLDYAANGVNWWSGA